MPASYDLRHVTAVLRELRKGPIAITTIAEATGIRARSVYRIIAELEQAGAPIQREPMETDGRGRPPEGLRLTVDGLREWLG